MIPARSKLATESKGVEGAATVGSPRLLRHEIGEALGVLSPLGASIPRGGDEEDMASFTTTLRKMSLSTPAFRRPSVGIAPTLEACAEVADEDAEVADGVDAKAPLKHVDTPRPAAVSATARRRALKVS